MPKKLNSSPKATLLIKCCERCSATGVKSGNFGHQVNLDIYLQTVEIQMRRLLPAHLDFHCLLCNIENPDETPPNEPSHQDFHCLLS